MTEGRVSPLRQRMIEDMNVDQFAAIDKLGCGQSGAASERFRPPTRLPALARPATAGR
jgi:hypothetical protein